MSAPTAAPPPLPLRHCYWVVPGLLLAGEHPNGATRDKTRDRLNKLLAVGIECFVDLTKPTELLRYDTELPFHVEYIRKPIKDHGVPGGRSQMVEILEYVANSMRAGRPVYVHCRAGIGRTGTVIGCLLVERGLSGDGALDELNRLWQQTRRSKTWTYIPETEAQSKFIREWQPSLQVGGFELSAAAAAVSAVGPMSTAGSVRPGVVAVADGPARGASQTNGVGTQKRGVSQVNGAARGGSLPNGAGGQTRGLSHANGAGQARGPSPPSSAGQARPTVQNPATGKGGSGSKSPGPTYAARGGLSAAAAQARAAVEHRAPAERVPVGRVPAERVVAERPPAERPAAERPAAERPAAERVPVGRVPAERPPADRLAEPAAKPVVEPDPLLDSSTLAAARGLRERFVGALFGLAVGDAVAAATQFRRPGSFSPVGDMIGGGPFDLPRGAWSDDTAMALCLAESLLERNGFDARDQVQRYGRWQQEGYLSATGQCVGITANTARSLSIAKWRRVVFPGSHDPEQLDPEPLSRVASIALYFFSSLEATLHHAAESSRTTCQAPAVLDACRRLGRALNLALSGQPKASILSETSLINEVAAQSNGTATTALAAAFWAFSSTDNFRDAVLRAANVGGNSDVVASVCGQLAGAHYGLSAIPAAWRNGLMQKELIEGYADRLLAHGLVSLSA